MNVMIVDRNSQALQQAAECLTSQREIMTLFLYSNARDALKFAIYHPMDIVYVRQTLAEMSGEAITDQILLFHPDVQCHVLQDGEDVPFAPRQSRSPPYGEAAGSISSSSPGIV